MSALAAMAGVGIGVGGAIWGALYTDSRRIVIAERRARDQYRRGLLTLVEGLEAKRVAHTLGTDREQALDYIGFVSSHLRFAIALIEEAIKNTAALEIFQRALLAGSLRLLQNVHDKITAVIAQVSEEEFRRSNLRQQSRLDREIMRVEIYADDALALITRLEFI